MDNCQIGVRTSKCTWKWLRLQLRIIGRGMLWRILFPFWRTRNCTVASCWIVLHHVASMKSSPMIVPKMLQLSSVHHCSPGKGYSNHHFCGVCWFLYAPRPPPGYPGGVNYDCDLLGWRVRGLSEWSLISIWVTQIYAVIIVGLVVFLKWELWGPDSREPNPLNGGSFISAAAAGFPTTQLL